MYLTWFWNQKILENNRMIKFRKNVRIIYRKNKFRSWTIIVKTISFQRYKFTRSILVNLFTQCVHHKGKLIWIYRYYFSKYTYLCGPQKYKRGEKISMRKYRIKMIFFRKYRSFNSCSENCLGTKRASQVFCLCVHLFEGSVGTYSITPKRRRLMCIEL